MTVKTICLSGYVRECSPNITGEYAPRTVMGAISGANGSAGILSGALTAGKQLSANGQIGWVSGAISVSLTLNASKSNSLYSLNKVQIPAFQTLIIIKV